MNQTQHQYSNITEKHLVDAIRQGDERALSELFDKYAAVFLGIIVKTGIEKNKAEEILHGSFMKIWAGISAGDFKGPFLFPWMMSIVRNSANEAKRMTNAPIHAAPKNVNDTELLEWIMNNGLTLEESAKQLNITQPALMLKIRTALAQLRTVTIE